MTEFTPITKVEPVSVWTEAREITDLLEQSRMAKIRKQQETVEFVSKLIEDRRRFDETDFEHREYCTLLGC